MYCILYCMRHFLYLGPIVKANPSYFLLIVNWKHVIGGICAMGK